MGENQSFQSNGKFYIARTDHVLNFEVDEFSLEAWKCKNSCCRYDTISIVGSKKSCDLHFLPSFCITLAYFLAASLERSSLLAPVHTILPELKMRAVVRGSLMRMITAANRFGLYSAFRACKAIFYSTVEVKKTVNAFIIGMASTENIFPT